MPENRRILACPVDLPILNLRLSSDRHTAADLALWSRVSKFHHSPSSSQHKGTQKSVRRDMVCRYPGFWDRSARQCHSALPSLIMQHINRPQNPPMAPYYSALFGKASRTPDHFWGGIGCGVSKTDPVHGVTAKPHTRSGSTGGTPSVTGWKLEDWLAEASPAVGAVSGMGSRPVVRAHCMVR